MNTAKTILSLALAASAALQTAHAGADWSISVQLPAPMQVVLPVPVSVPAPIYAPAPVAAPLPLPAPALPNIEQAQAAQHARIQWGAQVGLITGHEFNRLQHTQHYIEQQRRWAYADGWLTYEEHVQLLNLLNGAEQHIEHALANWHRVQSVHHPMPPVWHVWHHPRPHGNPHHVRPPVHVSAPHSNPSHPGQGHGNGHGNGHSAHRPPAPPAVPAALPSTHPHPSGRKDRKE